MSTLESIDRQHDQAFDVFIVDDCTTEDSRQRQMIQDFCEARDERWNYRLNEGEHKWALRNQIEALDILDPQDEDVIVWLDLDGDMLAHPRVLGVLRDFYDQNGVYMTYGNYEPYPNMGTHPVCDPFPDHVVQTGAYRQEILGGFCHFNHLRTMKGFVYHSIPRDYFFFEGTDRWYQGGVDYATMVPALELAGGKYYCFSEVLCHYNHGNPFADNITQRGESTASALNSLMRQPLEPLPSRERRVTVVPERTEPLYMTAEARRRLLLEMQQTYHLKYFVETGTSSGDTPEFLRDHFTLLYTIELDDALYAAACARFPQGFSNVKCYHGDSGEILPAVLAQVPDRALIWLDGHYCGPGSARGATDTPVVKELEAIFTDVAMTGRQHVIMIDDARIFGEGAEHLLEPGFVDYPDLSWIKQLARENNYGFLLENDVMRLVYGDL